MNHHIIYLPGLGDDADTLRAQALKAWSLFGVTTELVAMNWLSEPELEPKIQAVEAAIRRAEIDGKTVSLVGESGGAVIAIIMHRTHPSLHRVITVCGVAEDTIKIGEAFERRANALPIAVKHLQTTPFQPTTSLHSFRAFYDEVIEKEHTVGQGAVEHVLWTIGHIPTISLCLTVLSPLIIRVVKQP